MGYEAIILAGGLGTRLQTILSDKPNTDTVSLTKEFLQS
jgi:choline kinase